MDKIDKKVEEDFEMMLSHQWLPPTSWFASRVYWREVAERLPQRPENLGLAQTWVEDVLSKGTHVCSKKYILRWKEVLSEGMGPVVEILSSFSDEEPQVLRSCAPLALSHDLISDSERMEIHQKVKTKLKELSKGL